MIPIFSLIDVFVKNLSKPVMSQVKQWVRTSKTPSRRQFFLYFGQMDQRIESFLNRKLLGIEADSKLFHSPINEEAVIDKGIDFIFEFMLYSLILGVATNEIFRSARESARKVERERQEKLALIDEVHRLRAVAEELVGTANHQMKFIERMLVLERARSARIEEVRIGRD